MEDVIHAGRDVNESHKTSGDGIKIALGTMHSNDMLIGSKMLEIGDLEAGQ